LYSLQESTVVLFLEAINQITIDSPKMCFVALGGVAGIVPAI
jgi:hypothetical protein